MSSLSWTADIYFNFSSELNLLKQVIGWKRQQIERALPCGCRSNRGCLSKSMPSRATGWQFESHDSQRCSGLPSLRFWHDGWWQTWGINQKSIMSYLKNTAVWNPNVCASVGFGSMTKTQFSSNLMLMGVSSTMGASGPGDLK